MPKQLTPDLTDRIETVIRNQAEGLTAAQIAQNLTGEASPSSVARRIRRLIQQGRIQRRGIGRASRYVAPPAGPATEQTPASVETLQVEVYVPLSSDGEGIRDRVRRPIQARTPVSYIREFLENYRPNETFYLLPEQRKRLLELGRTSPATRPAGTYARDIIARLLIDLSWASSRLEGNTYTRLDTQQLIEFGKVAAGRDARETQMILNHKQAIEFLVGNADEIGFNTHTFFNLHALLAENLLSEANAIGRVRTRIVEVSGTTYYPLAVPQLLEELFQLILHKAGAIQDPMEQAFFVLVHIPYLQPFQDVNKRVSRLGANIPLIKGNLCPLSFVDVPVRAYLEGTLAVYELCRVELLRDVFLWAYERSCQRYGRIVESLAQPDPLRLKYRAQLREVVAMVIRDQLPPGADSVDRLATGLVADEDRPRFVRVVLEELLNLHEGNIARYPVRLAEFQAWKQRR